jgi:hypothetical protein
MLVGADQLTSTHATAGGHDFALAEKGAPLSPDAR